MDSGFSLKIRFVPYMQHKLGQRQHMTEKLYRYASNSIQDGSKISRLNCLIAGESIMIGDERSTT